jgi:hypothetical protein
MEIDKENGQAPLDALKKTEAHIGARLDDLREAILGPGDQVTVNNAMAPVIVQYWAGRDRSEELECLVRHGASFRVTHGDGSSYPLPLDAVYVGVPNGRQGEP